MKTLKFREKLSKLILSGKKTTTWRLFDDKDLQKGDVVSFVVSETKKEFAQAQLMDVKKMTLGESWETGIEGHEKYSSPEEMYLEFSTYYKELVNASTPVKVIRFLLVKKV